MPGSIYLATREATIGFDPILGLAQTQAQLQSQLEIVLQDSQLGAAARRLALRGGPGEPRNPV
jgi:hypothetical protein